MSHPTGPRPSAADEEAWMDLEARLAPLDARVPRTVPPWGFAALGAVILVGVLVSSVVALVAVVTLERWLIPNGDAADVSHGVALGGSMLVWGLLSLGLLAGAARVMLGRAATLGHGDLATAGLVLLLQAGWTVALHAWVVGVMGYAEFGVVHPGTGLWPGVVMLVTMALAAVRLTRGRTALGLLGFAGLAIAGLIVETLQNGLGAIADGDVSQAGLAVGVFSVAQLAVLGWWWWRTVRARLVG